MKFEHGQWYFKGNDIAIINGHQTRPWILGGASLSECFASRHRYLNEKGL